MKMKGYVVTDYRIGEIHDKEGFFHWSEIVEKFFYNEFESVECDFDKETRILNVEIR